MVNFTVEDHDGNRQEIEAPDDMGFSLMEILKASEYPVLATCGGMALCATCHVEILKSSTTATNDSRPLSRNKPGITGGISPAPDEPV